MTPNKVAMVFACVFLVVGILGFIPNPLVGEEGLFHADLMHNLVHLISAGVLFWAAKQDVAKASLVLRVLGFVYLVVVVLGFAAVGFSGDHGSLLGLMDINGADNVLHLLLAAVFLAAGYGKLGARA
jgi:hypothetical protein